MFRLFHSSLACCRFFVALEQETRVLEEENPKLKFMFDCAYLQKIGRLLMHKTKTHIYYTYIESESYIELDTIF
jgi:hypothetical protein